MGWMSWAKFYCEMDCFRHPYTCISEQLYMDMADRIGLINLLIILKLNFGGLYTFKPITVKNTVYYKYFILYDKCNKAVS